MGDKLADLATPNRSGSPAAAHVAATTGEERDRLVRLAYRFLWNLEDAEDAVQQALAIAHRQRDDLRDVSRRLPWLRRIVVSNCQQVLRQRKRRALGWRWFKTAVARAPAAAEPERSEIDDERRLALRSAIQTLPQRQREVVVLRHLEGLPYEEIGQILGITPGTARVHAQAGREALQARVRGPGSP